MSELRFDGEVVVVTGAGAGMGRGYALEFARRGASVVVNDLGGDVGGSGADASAAQQVVDQIVAAGGKAVANTASVATPEGGQSVVDTAMETYGRIDVLINNAGILRPDPFAELNFDTLRAVHDVHLMGAFHVTVPTYKVMQAQGGGRIINTSSGSVDRKSVV